MIKLVTGEEPMIQEALGYLRERYGMPSEDIQRLEIDAETGQPMRLTVTLVVREPAGAKGQAGRPPARPRPDGWISERSTL